MNYEDVIKRVMVPFHWDKDVKMLQGTTRSSIHIKGYASVFDHIDSHNDRVVRGAFQECLHSAQKPKFLWQHKDEEVIGVWHMLREDDHGLYVEGSLIPTVQKAKEAEALIAAKAIDGLSIGYRVRKAVRSPDQKSVRLLTNIDLLEISLVTFPANERARITQ